MTDRSAAFAPSGQIMSGKALLMKNPKPNETQARRGLSGQSLPLWQL
jgi:aerobic-type carbon monoxide dehydrogenase small subunit (CoxS/CutS family)